MVNTLEMDGKNVVTLTLQEHHMVKSLGAGSEVVSTWVGTLI